MPDSKPAETQLGRTHPLVKRVRLLSRSPEERAGAGLMVAEGQHLAAEALAEGARIHEAIVSPRLQRDARGQKLLFGLRAAGVTIRQATDNLLASLHEAESHQGILLIVQRPETPIPHIISSLDGDALVLVACGVQDPGNLGALVRLADAAGATAMLVAGGADPFGPKAARASAGSIFRLPLTRSSDMGETLAFAAALRQRGLVLAGAAAHGGVAHREAPLHTPLAIFLGGEAAGLPEEIARAVEFRVTVPINPRVESINVAAAAAILLFEAAARSDATIPRGPARPAAPQTPNPARRRPRGPAR